MSETSTGHQARAGELGPVLAFMRGLWELDHRLTQVSKAMRARHGVTGPQRLVIRIVGRYPGISAGELAGLLHLHPSTLTGILKRLVERRALARVPDESDARRALFDLTPLGRRLDDLRDGTVEARIRTGLRSLSRRDVRAAERVLRSLSRSLSQSPRAPQRRRARADRWARTRSPARASAAARAARPAE